MFNILYYVKLAKLRKSTTTFENFGDFLKISPALPAGILHLFFNLFIKNAQNAENAAEMLSGRHRVAFFIAILSP